MSAVLPTDKTLVNRAGVDHSTPADMSTVQDTDLLLINRAGVDYKCTFADWKNSQGKPPDVGAVTLADVVGGDRFTSVAFPVSATMTEDGLPISTKKLKAYVEGTLNISTTPQTDLITDVATNTLKLPNYSNGMQNWASTGPDDGDPGMFATTQPMTAFMRPGIQYKSGLSFTHLSGGGVMVYHSLRLYARVQPGQAATDTEFIAFNFPTTGYTSDRTGETTPPSSLTMPGVLFGDKAPLLGAWYEPVGYEWVTFTVTTPTLLTNLVVIGAGGTDTSDMGLTAIEVDGIRLTDNYDVSQTILTFASNKDLSYFSTYDSVQQSDGNATGTVAIVDAATSQMKFNNYLKPAQTGTWTVGQTVKGPTKTVPGANVKLYCKLDAAGAVSDLQSADPGFTAWTPAGTGPYTGTVTFPATLPTGKAPDADLPAGATITVEVEASNTSGSDSAKSNTLAPA